MSYDIAHAYFPHRFKAAFSWLLQTRQAYYSRIIFEGNSAAQYLTNGGASFESLHAILDRDRVQCGQELRNIKLEVLWERSGGLQAEGSMDDTKKVREKPAIMIYVCILFA